LLKFNWLPNQRMVCPESHRLLAGASPVVVVTVRRPRSRHRACEASLHLGDWMCRSDVPPVKGVQNNSPSLMDGLMAQMIAEAATESLKTNKPVKITY